MGDGGAIDWGAIVLDPIKGNCYINLAWKCKKKNQKCHNENEQLLK